MNKTFEKIYGYILTALFSVAIMIIPITVILGCLKLISMIII